MEQILLAEDGNKSVSFKVKAWNGISYISCIIFSFYCDAFALYFEVFACECHHSRKILISLLAHSSIYLLCFDKQMHKRVCPVLFVRSIIVSQTARGIVPVVLPIHTHTHSEERIFLAIAARSRKYPAEKETLLSENLEDSINFKNRVPGRFPDVAGSVRESPLLNGESQSGTPKPFFHSLIYGINLAAANSWLTFEIVIYYS